EGRQELGLDHDETRSWRGWHHHLTLVILAHHFLVRLQRRLDPRAGGHPPGPGAAAAGDRARGAAGPAPAAPAGGAERGRGARAAARCCRSQPSTRWPRRPGWPTNSGASWPPLAPTVAAACAAWRDVAHAFSRCTTRQGHGCFLELSAEIEEDRGL